MVRLCADNNIAVSFDAEEASSYLLYFNRISGHPDLENYEGIGFVVQAYQKRASYIIDYIINLAKTLKNKVWRITLSTLYKGIY
ncbi:MAG: proline dehydrogenase family protein [Candidatus Midichloria sp.]|uniref:Bifunctional protein PutA n=1 Tax=Hyalomma marginatum TaxID=34627 RepID=A0A8S4C1H3_9ACAR|nr:Bifunctional protein PutA [Hyalomma marginatum]CAG7599236.1 Bifunctional protein PutA [Hyalomma marginatum]